MMTDWKILSKKIIQNSSLQKKQNVKNLPHFFLHKSEKYLLGTTACKKVVQKAICKQSCEIKTSGGGISTTFLIK